MLNAQGNQLAHQLAQLSKQAQAATQNGLRSTLAEVIEPDLLGLDLGLPQGVTVTGVFPGTRGSST